MELRSLPPPAARLLAGITPRWEPAFATALKGRLGMSCHSPICRAALSWRCCLLCWLAHAAVAVAVEPPPLDPAEIEPAVVEEVSQTLAALDDPQFTQRERAEQRLYQLVDQGRLAFFLAAEFNRVMQLADTSVEVRTRLTALAQRLPPAPPLKGEGAPSADQIAPLVDLLQADACSQRDAARRRLRGMLEHESLIAPLWLELKRRAADGELSAAMRRELSPLLDEARRAWLLAEPNRVALPAVSDEQMSRLIDAAVQLTPGEDSLARFRREQAERELLDLVARDDTRDRLLELLEKSIAARADDASAVNLLRYVADFTRPAMAAEVWGNRQHLTVQYLLVGLPQLNMYDGNGKSTHFDRIDEHTAHCVAGNSLLAGDYPVRIAISHPEPGVDRMFYLTNLPTPRRRLAYEYLVRRDPELRLREITQRTVNDILGTQRLLSENEVLLLAQLDPTIVSRFVGPYFQNVPDRRLVTTTMELGGQTTVHGGICVMLTRLGTRDAVPALEQLARSEKLKPSFESPYQIAWIAALAIAQRDPWPGVDQWLAGLIDNTTQLVITGDGRPELGASAAALLLDRHGASTRPFGLETIGEAATERLRFTGYRFTSQHDREDVKRWWAALQKRSDQQATP